MLDQLESSLKIHHQKGSLLKRSVDESCISEYLQLWILVMCECLSVGSLWTRDCPWRHNKLMLLMNFYHRAHTGMVITKDCYSFPMPICKCFSTYQDKCHRKKGTFFVWKVSSAAYRAALASDFHLLWEDCCSCIIRPIMSCAGRLLFNVITIKSSKKSNESLLFITLGSKSDIQTWSMIAGVLKDAALASVLMPGGATLASASSKRRCSTCLLGTNQ